MRPALFLQEATQVKRSPGGTLTSVPAYPPRNRPASTWRKPSRQRNVDETWPAIPRGQSYSYDSTVRGQPPHLAVFRLPYQRRDRAAIAFLVSCPLVLPS